MTKKAIMELTQVITKRYLNAKTRREKTMILNEYCANTGLHRKYAITKIQEICFKDKEIRKRGRKKKYSVQADILLIRVWKAYDRICGERLHPFLEEGIKKLKQFGHINPDKKIEAEVLGMSQSTVKRRIKKERKRLGKSQFSTTKPGTLLKKAIPIKTICWNENTPGYCEIDLVAHCGGSLSGDFIYTLQFVDICTTWTERKAVMGKGQLRVFEAIKEIRQLLPFVLKGIDSDNGSEFLNFQLMRYCNNNNIEFTRSRPYMKKDNAHIEQKNYPLVRKVLGYDRFDTQKQLFLINSLYDNELRLYLNFFIPSLKLKGKIKIGSKYQRKYGEAKTPYRRVLEHPNTSQKQKEILIALYNSLDPIKLKKKIDTKVKNIISLVR